MGPPGPYGEGEARRLWSPKRRHHMVSRGNVNTARITRYRSYEAVIGGRRRRRGGASRVMINRFSFYTADLIDTDTILTRRRPPPC